VVDKGGKIVYVQLVPEITQEPNYEEVVAKAKSLLSKTLPPSGGIYK